MRYDDLEPDCDPTLWGWVAGAVVLALVLMFVFTHPAGSAPVPKIGPVTATVTNVPLRQAEVMSAQEWHVVLKNEETGLTHPWTRRTWNDKDKCDEAAGNLNLLIDAILDPDPERKVPDPSPGMDMELVQTVSKVMEYLIQNTGRLPKLSLSCQKKPTEA